MDFRYLYLGRSSRGLVKIGIARDVKARWNDIDKSTPGSRERPTFAVRILFAYAVEQMLHRLFWLFRRKHNGSGKTEWFRFPFPMDWIAISLCVVILTVWRVISVVIIFALVVALLGSVGTLAYIMLSQ